MRAWKPGDVAIGFDADWAIPVARHRGDPDYWSALNGAWPVGVSAELLDFRPLVVIDPEDAEEVQCLLRAYYSSHGPDVRYDEELVAQMQAALRELADPKPRIEEPTGLGAVVELSDGRHAVRTWQPVQPWSHLKDGLPFLDRWQDIDVVRVLSEGWSE